jgi:hypothetical protein
MRNHVIFFHAPEFFPPLDFFFGLLNSDLWVVLDHVIFTTRSRQSRCRVKTDSGVQLLALAVKRPCNKPICDMVIDNAQPWRKAFLKAIERNYSDSPFFLDYYRDVRNHVEAPHVLLETFTLETTLWAASLMGKQVEFIRTSPHYTKYPTSKIIPILLDKFEGALFNEQFVHPYYPQRTEPFERDLSILDVLFNVGKENAKVLLTTKQTDRKISDELRKLE